MDFLTEHVMSQNFSAQKPTAVSLAGQQFELFANGGIYWPAQKTLLVADTHFGKEATFRRASIAVPAGSTDGTLRSLTGLMTQTAAERIVFLGDLFHCKSSLSPSIREALQTFWSQHQNREFVLVRGNHDVATGRLPSQWPLVDVGPKWRIENIALEHFPIDPPPACDLLFCGHLHPSIRLRHGADRMGKLACFWLSGKTLVLPAMGHFTGTSMITPQQQDKVWLCVEESVIEYPHEAAKRVKQKQTV